MSVIGQYWAIISTNRYICLALIRSKTIISFHKEELQRLVGFAIPFVSFKLELPGSTVQCWPTKSMGINSSEVKVTIWTHLPLSKISDL